MKAKEVEKKLIVIFGVVLALLIPIVMKVFGHNIEVEIIMALIIVYLSYLIWSVLHTEEEIEGMMHTEKEIELDINELCKQIEGTGIDLIGPHRLHYIQERVEENTGDVWFFNIPLGRIRTEEGFEVFIGAAARNPNTKKILFLLDRSVEELWKEEVEPKLEELKDQVRFQIRWLTVKSSIAFMYLKGSSELYMFVLEEPFIAPTPKGAQTMALIRISQKPEFIAKFEEIFEKDLLSSDPDD